MISVERSLTGIDGVKRAVVSLERAEAVVTFDDEKTGVEALLRATRSAGYPSRPKRVSR